MLTGVRPETRGRGDRGSALMLMPAGVLVLLILAAIAADLSHVHMARAKLNDVAATIANDVSTAGLDTAIFRNEGRYELNDALAGKITDRLIAAQSTSTLRNLRLVEPLRFDHPGGSAVVLTVTLRAEVDYIFAKAIPGAGDTMTITAQSDVTLIDQH